MSSIKINVPYSAIASMMVFLGLTIGGCENPRLDWTGTLPELPIIIQNQPPSPIPTSLLERQVLQQINQYRTQQRLPPLKLNARISQEARKHSQQMATETAPFSHDGFKERVEAIAADLPLQSAGENIAFNQGLTEPAKVAFQGWLKSPGHRKTMEGDFNLTGIGVAQSADGTYFFSQIFLKQRSPTAGLSPYSQNPISKNNSLIALEQAIHKGVNQYRLSRSLAPVRKDERISHVARKHSQAMARGSMPFSHDGFKKRVKTIALTIPYRKAGENLAMLKGYPDLVGTAIQGWIDSPGHRKTMEGDFNLAGIGIAKNAKGEYYFTQIFVQQR